MPILGIGVGLPYVQQVATVAAPVNTILPAITGTAQVGQTLTVSNGTWTGSPSSFSYQWKVAGSNVGTNQNTYVPVSGDAGSTATCTVTASNAGGSTPATSAATGAISVAAPTVSSIAISATDGESIAVTFSENITASANTNGWTIHNTTQSTTPAFSYVSVVGNALNFILTTPARKSDAFTADYNASLGSVVASGSGNPPLTTFSGTSITNNSTVVVFDTFTDTNGTNITAHTADVNQGSSYSVFWGGPITIQSNTAQQTGASSTSAFDTTAIISTGTTNVSVQIDITSPSSGSWQVGVCARATDQQNQYAFLYDSPTGNLEIQSGVSGTFTNLSPPVSFSWSTSVTHTLKLVISGSTLNAYVDGTLKFGPITNTAITSGNSHGLLSLVSGAYITATFDNLKMTSP